jgi:hypothetical protein
MPCCSSRYRTLHSRRLGLLVCTGLLYLHLGCVQSQEIDPAFEGLKGTTWSWNNWREVTFGCDGSFVAPTPDCEPVGRCTWWADASRVYIEWSRAGRHTLRRSASNPDSELRRLQGQRESDGDPCSAVWRKDGDCPQDWYALLGIAPEATAKEIAKRFRKVSLTLHPDKPGGDAVAFAKVAEAYEVLGDPDRRALYDKQAGHANNVRFEPSLRAPAVCGCVQKAGRSMGHPLSKAPMHCSHIGS